MSERLRRHRLACEEFARAASAAEGRWDAPSPCEEWDARGVVEHVIGFHEILLIGPLGVEVSRPDDDPAARWEATAQALFAALERPGVLEEEVEIPGMGTVPAEKALPILTTDVLAHTWDLARAVGADDTLDEELCAAAYERALKAADAIRSSGMFGPEVPVGQDASVQARLLALLGRDPDWAPGAPG